MKKILILILMVNIYLLNSIEFTGTGFGKTQEEANIQALKDLSNIIILEINLKTFSKTNDVFSSGSIFEIDNGLQLYGVKFKVERNTDPNNKYKCYAALSSVESLDLYKNKLEELETRVEAYYKALIKQKNDSDENINNLITNIKKFDKMRQTALILGGNDLSEIDISIDDVKNILIEKIGVINSIDKLSQYIINKIDFQGIYCFPVVNVFSSEITEFSKKLDDRIDSKLKNPANDVKSAKYFLRGKYKLINDGKDGIEIYYNLSDTTNNVLLSRFARISPDSYKDYEFKPQLTEFNKLLKDNNYISNDFRIDISTNQGTNDLLFKKGNEIEIFIKANKSCYIFIVGYILKDKDRFAYMLELNSEAMDTKKFMMFINADDVNKWFSIGKYTVDSPYGIESLQVIGSTGSLLKSIPKSTYNEKLGYYFLSNDINGTVTETRGLKTVKDAAVKYAETSLLFTTSEK